MRLCHRARVAAAVACILACVVSARSAGADDRNLRDYAANDASAGIGPNGAFRRAEDRLIPYFVRAGVLYPPRDVTLIALKQEARLELWARSTDRWVFVRSYLIQAASGRLGPKLKQGDRQVPEGLYRIAGFNAQSRYHLAMRLDYPNAFDRAQARADRRLAPLGGDIMIHGGSDSIGCLAIGNRSVEELFALGKRLGPGNVSVIVSPLDLRRTSVTTALARIAAAPPWLAKLYYSIAYTLYDFPLPSQPEIAPPPARQLTVARAKCRAHDQDDCIRRCEEGDWASCASAGLSFRERGTASDAAKTWELLRDACAGGNALGCAELSVLHVEDDGLRRDVGFAAELARAACSSGEGLGCTYLANICADGILYTPNRDACSRENIRRLRDQAVALSSYIAPERRTASASGTARASLWPRSIAGSRASSR